MVDGGTSQLSEPEFVALGIELREEDVVEHRRGVYHIEGERIAELPGDIEMIIRRANDIRLAAKNLSVDYHGRLLGTITISLGVANFPEHGDTGEALLRLADAALYRAKRQGRDQVATAALA